MKVIVTKVGFLDGSLRQPGTILDVPENFKASWVVPYDTKKAEELAPKAPAKEKPQALSERAVKGKSFNEVVGGKAADLA